MLTNGVRLIAYRAKATGVYSPQEFHLVSTNASTETAATSENLLPILEALGMCTQVQFCSWSKNKMFSERLLAQNVRIKSRHSEK